MTLVFYLCAIVAFFVVLHGLVYQDEMEVAFVIALILFLTCIWISNQYRLKEFVNIPRIEGEP